MQEAELSAELSAGLLAEVLAELLVELSAAAELTGRRRPQAAEAVEPAAHRRRPERCRRPVAAEAVAAEAAEAAEAAGCRRHTDAPGAGGG